MRSDFIIQLGCQPSIAAYYRSVINLLHESGFDRRTLLDQTRLNVGIKTTSICLDCGNRQVREDSHPILTITNETMEVSKKKTVKIKVVYISDYDNYKMYEVRMSPGEYSFQEVIGKIKEKVQMDRLQIKLCKRTFCLVDLF